MPAPVYLKRKRPARPRRQGPPPARMGLACLYRVAAACGHHHEIYAEAAAEARAIEARGGTPVAEYCGPRGLRVREE